MLKNQYPYCMQNVSEERIAFIFKAEKSTREETASVNTWLQSAAVHTRPTRCHIPEDGILHSHRRENLILQT
jgi:hypothetical protein